VGAGGPSWEIPLSHWQWVFGVNFWGVVHGIRSFVPLLLEQGEGHVVNTASAAGLTAVPFMGPYTASKHAVVALSEALSLELALSGGRVGASVLCPMWVKTRIAESERNAPSSVREVGSPESGFGADLVANLVAGGMEPELVADHVVAAVKENRFYVLPHQEVIGTVRARVDRMASGLQPELQFPL
jgi:NAD(P)-dependent dehydrogenase (short-subunit alcohol dehydrogenase family)